MLFNIHLESCLFVLGCITAMALAITPFRLYKLNARECQARQKSVGVQLLQRPQFRGTRGLALVHGTPDELQTKGSTYALMTVKSRENLKVDGEVPQKKNFGVTVSTRAGSLWKYIKHEISVYDVCYDQWPSKKRRRTR